MLSQIQIRDAIDVVLGWDLPDSAFGDAVITPAHSLAGQRRD